MSQTPAGRNSVTGDKPRFRREVRSLVPRLLQWFAAHARDRPWRRTNDPYAIGVSEIMLQQTQFKTIIPYYERWKKVMIAVSGPFHRNEINFGSHSTGHH